LALLQIVRYTKLKRSQNEVHMEQLIKALPAVLQAAGHSPEVVEAAAIAAWKHLTGNALRRQAIANSLNGKTLVIAVSDAIWQKQLESMRGQLLFRLNSILGQPLVNRLEFRIDYETVQHSLEPVFRKEANGTSEEEISLELWSAANAIQDKQLRKTFLAAASTSLQRKENKR